VVTSSTTVRPAIDTDNANSRIAGTTLAAGRVRLAPPDELDFEYLYQLSIAEQTGFRWRYRGAIPSREAFAQALWHDVLAQFVITVKPDNERAGLVVAHNADVRNGFAYVSLLLEERWQRCGIAVEAAGLMLTYLFDNWNFAKVYGEMPEFNYGAVLSGEGGLFQLEARLPSHHYYRGRRWDHLILALYREDWERLVGATAPGAATTTSRASRRER
jgi:RimJ/RimL family protein N-acetyltransferase